MKKLPLLIVAVLAVSISVSAQSVTVTRADGGPIKTKLISTIVVNGKSGLSREWIAIHDPSLMVDLAGTPGATTIYKDQKYAYTATIPFDVKEPVSAIEVRILTFDVFGGHVSTLSTTEVQDFAVGPNFFTSEWRVLTENEVSEYYACITYIARVRLASGKVLIANSPAVIEEAKKFSRKFTEEDLEPKK